MKKATFGPGGNGDWFYSEGKKSTLQAPGWLKEKGLDAFEYEAGNGIAGSEADQFLIEVHTLGKLGVLAADGDRLVLESKGGIHVVHTGELHQNQTLVNMAGGGLYRLAFDIKGFKTSQELWILTIGLHAHLATDAVGVDNLTGFNILEFHKLTSQITNKS